MPTVKQAIDIVKQVAPSLSPGGVALVVAIAGLESGIGNGFLPHYNWGAEHAGTGWTGATFEHEDSGYKPGVGVVRYVTLFRDYGSDESAALGLSKVIRSQYPAAIAAADRGDWYGASRALYGYYQGNKPKAGAIRDHYTALSKWLRLEGISPGAIGAAFGLEALLWGGVAWFGLRAARRKR